MQLSMRYLITHDSWYAESSLQAAAALPLTQASAIAAAADADAAIVATRLSGHLWKQVSAHV